MSDWPPELVEKACLALRSYADECGVVEEPFVLRVLDAIRDDIVLKQNMGTQGRYRPGAPAEMRYVTDWEPLRS